jgi:hypothetical protein
VNMGTAKEKPSKGTRNGIMCVALYYCAQQKLLSIYASSLAGQKVRLFLPSFVVCFFDGWARLFYGTAPENDPSK